MSSFQNEFLQWSRKQSRGSVILLLLLIASIALYYALPFWVKPNITAAEQSKLDAIVATLQTDAANESYSFSKNEEAAKLTPFTFNPNTLDSSGFIRLGLRPRVVHTILNARRKGWTFYKPENFKKMYGLHEDEYKQLEPYISIPSPYGDKPKYEKKTLHIELNSADTSQLVELPMIGSKLALNIVKYRETLGGFAKKEQIKEVFGISEETYKLIAPSLSVNSSNIKKLKLSEATYNDLNAHPYLRGELAKAIADWRKAKKYQINSLSELKEIELVSEEIFRKIAPYIAL